MEEEASDLPVSDYPVLGEGEEEDVMQMDDEDKHLMRDRKHMYRDARSDYKDTRPEWTDYVPEAEQLLVSEWVEENGDVKGR